MKKRTRRYWSDLLIIVVSYWTKDTLPHYFFKKPFEWFIFISMIYSWCYYSESSGNEKMYEFLNPVFHCCLASRKSCQRVAVLFPVRFSAKRMHTLLGWYMAIFTSRVSSIHLRCVFSPVVIVLFDKNCAHNGCVFLLLP